MAVPRRAGVGFLRAAARQARLLARVYWTACRHRQRHPLVSASLRGALRWALPRLRGRGVERSMLVTAAQMEWFLERGWEYTERRLELLRAVAAFPFDHRGARQLWAVRERMEFVRGGSFENVDEVVYADPLYAVFQHVGQAFRNEVSGRLSFVRDALAALATEPADVCDAGCGSGILLGDVLEACASARGHGLDVSRVMLDHATRVMAARGLDGRTTLIAADIRRLPFASGTFDFLIANEVLEHLPDPAEGLRELQRVLRPGAVLSSSIPVGDDVPTHLCVFRTVDEVLALHRAADMEVIRHRVVEVGPGVPDVMVAGRKRH